MFCSKCGTEIPANAEFCFQCGVKIVNDTVQPPPDAAPSPPAAANYANNNFLKKLHSYGSSPLFLTGIIMFSIGGLYSIFASFNILVVLPIIGFWFIFAASKAPKVPEKTLTAVTLFKIPVIFMFVIVCIAIFLCIIGSIAIFIASAVSQEFIYEVSWAGYIIGVVLLAFSIGFFVYYIIYFKASLNVLNGIRDGIYKDSTAPIRSVGLLSAFIFINAAFVIFSLISYLATVNILQEFMLNFMNEFFYQIPYDFMGNNWEWFDNVFYNVFIVNIIFNFIQTAGTILCVITLIRFNNSLIAENYNRL